MTIPEMNNKVVSKWLNEANEKELSVFCMIGLGQDASSEIFALLIDKDQAISKLRDLADRIESGEYQFKNVIK